MVVIIYYYVVCKYEATTWYIKNVVSTLKNRTDRYPLRPIMMGDLLCHRSFLIYFDL